MLTDNENETNEVKSYTMTLEERLHKKLEGHLKVLQHIDSHSHSKQRWIIDAINRKLEKEKRLSKDMITDDKRISLRVTHKMDQKIQNMVNLQKKFRKTPYSKKQWIADAIYEKLQEEEAITNEFLDSLSKSS